MSSTNPLRPPIEFHEEFCAFLRKRQKIPNRLFVQLAHSVRPLPADIRDKYGMPTHATYAELLHLFWKHDRAIDELEATARRKKRARKRGE